MATVKAKAGKLTEAEAAEYARRFEEELEPHDFRPRKTGRPPLGDDYPSPRIQVRVSQKAFAHLTEQASAEGTTLSALVRRLLEQAPSAARPGRRSS